MIPRKPALLVSLICLLPVGRACLVAQESQDNQPHIQPRSIPTPSPTPAPRYTAPPFPQPELSSQQGESSSKDAQIDPSGTARARPEAVADPNATDEKAFRPYDPHRAAKDLEIGSFYLKQKNYRAALERFNDALLYKPDDAESIYGLAVTQDKLDLPDKARKNYSKYLEILPQGPRAKDCEEALKRIDARTASAPAADSAAAQSARDIDAGETFLTRNQYDAARERFEDAMRLTPDNPLICFRLAQSLQGLERLEPARSYYRKYLQLAPHGPFVSDAKRAIADITWVVGK
ncbi:MAG TPA: tetratricopeptide repeat protein [Terriglobales bacterium]